MNCTNFIGRIVKDLELKGNDTKVLKFTLAVNRAFKKEGQQQADFIPCVAFNNTAIFMSKYMAKGSNIGVKGELQSGSYEKDGTKIYTLEVKVDNVYFADGKKDAPKNDAGFTVVDAESDDELPF